MIVWICTDMEGLTGIDDERQCYDTETPDYQYGREQLTADVNAAVAGCFDAGATEVRVLDGHGPNNNQGFIPEKLDPRVKKVWWSTTPGRFEGLDESVDAVAMIGQHSMAGTLHGFLDHTQCMRVICRYMINGEERGEMSQCALYAGGYGVPLVYVSGDEAVCREAARQFPHVISTPTKNGLGWSKCELYPEDQVRANIRKDIAKALGKIDKTKAWKLEPPVEVTIEYAYSEYPDQMENVPGVTRLNSRTVTWKLADQRDIYHWPSESWSPVVSRQA